MNFFDCFNWLSLVFQNVYNKVQDFVMRKFDATY